MVDMREIFKHKGDSGKDPEKPKPQETKPTQETPQKIQGQPLPTEKPIKPPGKQIEKPTAMADLMKPKSEEILLPLAEVSKKCQEIYQKGVDVINRSIADIKNGQKVKVNEFLDLTNLVLQQLDEGKDALIELAYCSEQEEHLSNHLVNVSIFSLIVSLPFEYRRDRLVELGMAALMYDLGMVDFLDLAGKPYKLTSEESKKRIEHVNRSEMIFKSTGYEDKDQQIVSAMVQHHERLDGSGYPSGLKGSEISELARIIGLMDTFESLTHKCSWRNKMLAFDAIKEILSKKTLYDRKAIKSLLDNITVYPTGSWVVLNSEDIGRVVRLQRSWPLRPIVEICRDKDGRTYEDKKIIDLSKSTTLYIKRPLDK